MVRQGRSHLQRRHRHRPPDALVRTGFSDIPDKPGKCRNSQPTLAKTHRSRLLHDLKCAKSNLGSLARVTIPSRAFSNQENARAGEATEFSRSGVELLGVISAARPRIR